MSSSTPLFTHLQEGTAESVWWSAPQWDNVPILDLPALTERFSKVLVAAAHPDDETLGIGGLLTDLATLGVPIHILIATAGERSRRGLDGAGRARLAQVRRQEVEEAVAGLAPHASLIHLGLPDAELSHHEDDLCAEMTRRIDERTLILAPWTHDGHTDHDALGRAAACAAELAGAVVAHFPIWLWHWSDPASLPWSSMVASDTSLVGSWRKRAALDSFVSQRTACIDGFDGTVSAPILGATALARGRRLIETLIDVRHEMPVVTRGGQRARTTSRRNTFDEMYDDGPDPWRNSGSFYEERRRDLVLALLSRPHYQRVLELGCADGYLTAALLSRAERVSAIDTSAQAVAAARRAAPRAVIEQGNVPHDIPAGPFDLVTLCEVGYFLTPTELVATLRRARAALAPGGELLLCHWQHPTNGVPLDGTLVHEQARSMLGSEPRARHQDEDVCIEVWGDAPSVAVSEGRV